jgi:hypothetical protein
MSALIVVAAGLTACAGDLQGGPAGQPSPPPTASSTVTPVPTLTPPAAPHAAATPAAAEPAPSASSCSQYPNPPRTGKLVPCPGVP